MTEQAISQQAAPEEEAFQPQYADYWGTDERVKFFLPDDTQYFEFKIMDEGDKAKFQRMTNQDLIVGRDNTAKVRVDPAKERHELIKTSVVDWYLFKDGKPTNFDKGKLEKWLSVANPKIVEQLEFEIRKANPWMQADMDLDELYKERDRIEELIKQKVEQDAGESGSANK